MKEIFRGHIQDCVRHLSARMMEVVPRGTTRSRECKDPISKFCGVTVHTITDWFLRNRNFPRGVVQLRLICYLEINGYTVTEFEKLQPVCKNIARLIGYRIISVEEAVSILGYNRKQEVYLAIWGKIGLTSDRERTFWETWKARRDRLDQLIEENEVKYRFNPEDFVTQPTPVETEVAPAVAEPKVGCPRDGVIQIMGGLLQILDSGAMQNLSPDDWEKIRRSGEVVLRLSSHLSTLSAQLVKPS